MCLTKCYSPKKQETCKSKMYMLGSQSCGEYGRVNFSSVWESGLDYRRVMDEKNLNITWGCFFGLVTSCDMSCTVESSSKEPKFGNKFIAGGIHLNWSAKQPLHEAVILSVRFLQFFVGFLPKHLLIDCIVNHKYGRSDMDIGMAITTDGSNIELSALRNKKHASQNRICLAHRAVGNMGGFGLVKSCDMSCTVESSSKEPKFGNRFIAGGIHLNWSAKQPLQEAVILSVRYRRSDMDIGMAITTDGSNIELSGIPSVSKTLDPGSLTIHCAPFGKARYFPFATMLSRKRIHARVEPVMPSRCTEEIKQRVKKNGQLKEVRLSVIEYQKTALGKMTRQQDRVCDKLSKLPSPEGHYLAKLKDKTPIAKSK
ncbi:hypothetical protein Tco_0065903 [Tanacetum coccineum]